MQFWPLMFILLAGGLLAFKVAYVLGRAIALPATKGAMYVPSSRVRVSAFLDAVTMRPDQLFVDLGCGDGRVLRKARKRYHVKAVGYELNPFAYLKARLTCLGLRGVDIRLQNFFKADLSQADVVFCYLFPDVMQDVAAKLKSDLKPSTLVVSCNFILPGFTPQQVLRPGNSLHNDPIFIYQLEEQ